MGDIAIHVENVSKLYHIGKSRTYKTARESLMSVFSRAKNDPATELWALRDVSFEVPRGEVVGIIGRNGAGKSTLLKVLSRITEPTTGKITLKGRVGSLLEVGTGFHPELTGRENIFLNGAILGMRRAEIARSFDAIVEFSEIARFLDTPVKHYSSGMYMRLAFAVAAHLEPEILIVDEVLAVGDAAFQDKCLGKMRDVVNEGRTVLFVSHNMAAIKRLCRRAILMGGGKVLAQGPVDEVVAEMVRSQQPGHASLESQSIRATVTFERDGQKVDTWPSHTELDIIVDVQSDAPISDLAVDLALFSEHSVKVFSIQSDLVNRHYRGRSVTSGRLRFRVTNVGLGCHELSIDLGVRGNRSQHYLALWPSFATLGITTDESARGTIADSLVLLPCTVTVEESAAHRIETP